MTELFGEALPLILPLVIASVFAGFSAGLLGIGGGIVIVPILFMMLSRIQVNNEVIMHICIATSLAMIVPTSISSMRAHIKGNNFDKNLVRKWGGWIAVGALLGAFGASSLKSTWLQAVFSVFLTLIALNMFRPVPVKFDDSPPERIGLISVQGISVGFFSAILGIGGASFSVPLMSSYGVNTRIAVGTASIFGLMIALPAALGFMISGMGVAGRPAMSLGFVWLLALIIIIPITISMAPIGARVAHRIDAHLLRMIFALFLIVAGGKMGLALL